MAHHCWEAVGGDAFAADLVAGVGFEPDPAEDPERCSASHAAEMLFEMLVDMKFSGTLPATKVCVLAFWAAKAGAIGGDVEKLGFPPGKHSSGYSRHFDKVVSLPTYRKDHYTVNVTLTRRFDATRQMTPVATIPPHEHLWNTVQESGTVALKNRLAEMTLPRAYTRHPIVVAAGEGELCWPLAIYLDGVQYAREDSALGLWVIDIINNKHNLIAAIAQSTLCNCGCRGLCSIWQLFDMLDWSFTALAEGVHPRRRHDGTASDSSWVDLPGAPMGFKAVVVIIKGDWAEFCGSLGFPTWGSADHPCFKCVCTRDTIYVTRGLSALATPLAAKTMDTYLGACAGAEIVIHPVPDALWRRVRVLLFYDVRLNGNRGRCLAGDIPEYGLETGDRLEPSEWCRDIGAGFEF